MHRSRIVVVLILALLAWLFAPAAEAVDPIRAVLQSGGDRLVDLQNADGGWFFTVGDPDCGYGPGVSCPNTFGVTGLGVLAAYRGTRDADFRNAARATGNALVDKFTSGLESDCLVTTSDDRPITPDVTFLVDLAKNTGNARYRQVAKAWFAALACDFPNAADRADDRIARRDGQGLTNLGAWDAGNDIAAALAVNNRKYALAELKQVIALASTWDVDDPDCPGCELLSKGWLLYSMDAFPGDPLVRTTTREYRDALLATQQPDGSWKGDTQITAYIVLGLDTLPRTPPVRQALQRAVGFLLAMQSANGGFDSGNGTEVTEVDSEVLWALQAVR